MTIETCLANNAKLAMLEGYGLGTSTPGWKMALYTEDATLGPTTAAYTATEEIGDTGDYEAGGFDLTSNDPALDGNVAIADFEDVTLTNVTADIGGAMIYRSADSNKAFIIFAFPSVAVVVAGDFVVEFPPAAAYAAVLSLD